MEKDELSGFELVGLERAFDAILYCTMVQGAV